MFQLTRHRTMYRFITALLLWVSFERIAAADMIFTVVPSSNTAIFGQDTPLVFDIYVQSTVDEPINAIDFNAIAGLGDGSDGVFMDTSRTFFLGSDPPDVISTPGQAFSTNSLAVGISFSTNELYARLFLDVSGVAIGTYSLTLDSLAANSTMSGSQVARTNAHGNNVIYTISAVPEPSSLAMLLPALVGILARRRRDDESEC